MPTAILLLRISVDPTSLPLRHSIDTTLQTLIQSVPEVDQPKLVGLLTAYVLTVLLIPQDSARISTML